MSDLTSALHLASAVALHHEVSSPGAITLIPVVVDDLHRALAFLEPLCELAGGVVFNCADPSLAGPVPGTADPLIRAAVETQLVAASSAGRRVGVLDPSPGMLDVEWQNPPAGSSLSPGEATVLAVARAVLHADWERHELVILAYQDGPIDLTFREQVWKLGTQQLAQMPHTSVRTVVFLVQSALDIGLHGAVDTGFQLALDGPRLLRRTGRDNLNHWANVLSADPTGVVLFLGAGFAASSRLPMGNGLRDSAIKRLLGIDTGLLVGSRDLALRFRAWITPKAGWVTLAESQLTDAQFAEQLTLEQVIRAEARTLPALPSLAEFKAHHDAVLATPGAAVRDLAAMLASAPAHRLVLAGVNFDQLVEVHAAAGLRVFSTDSDFADAPDYLARYLAGKESDVPYLKLHGSIENAASCIVNADQTDTGLSTNKTAAVRSLLPTAGDRRRWVYVGASMRDRDLARIFNDADFSQATDEVWVAPWLADTVEAYMRLREPFWKDRSLQTGDDRLISVTADEFLAALRAAW